MELSTQVTGDVSLGEFLKLSDTKPPREYIDGCIYQKPIPQGKHSRIQTCLSTNINQVGEPLTNLSNILSKLHKEKV